MCRRAGTPLKDLYSEIVDLPAEKINDYIKGGINVRRITGPRIGALAYSIYKRNVHVAYIVGKNLALHATIDMGVKLSPLSALRPIAYYEVVNESNNL